MPTQTTPHFTVPDAVQRWLLACLTMVVLMVFIGGLTRLTESGLSIVEWKLASGIFPPISQEAWQQEFTAYQSTPEYLKKNTGMSLTDFKGIFWLEYIHRLLGRLVGVVFFVPFAYFLLRKQLPAPLGWRLAGIFALGGLQGGVGWVMVQSGLVDDPRVNPFKLAAHLGIAFLIAAALIWTWLDTRPRAPSSSAKANFWPAGIALAALLYLQVLFGALVAGYDAGLTYNSFPLMDGQWIPQGLLLLEPLSRNFTENIMLIQFQHRWLAKLLVVAAAAYGFWILHRSDDTALRILAKSLLVLMLAQFALGVVTLLAVVPISLASAHQMLALFLFGTMIALLHRLRVIRSQTDS